MVGKFAIAFIYFNTVVNERLVLILSAEIRIRLDAKRVGSAVIVLICSVIRIECLRRYSLPVAAAITVSPVENIGNTVFISERELFNLRGVNICVCHNRTKAGQHSESHNKSHNGAQKALEIRHVYLLLLIE